MPRATQHGRLAVRLLFAATLLALPLQVVVREVWSEPYPGLYQPAFGGAPTSTQVATAFEPAVTVVGTDGARTPVDIEDLLPPTAVSTSAVFRSALYRPGQDEDAMTRAWIRKRVLLVMPDSDPALLEVQWQDVEYDLHDGQRRVAALDALVVLDLRSER